MNSTKISRTDLIKMCKDLGLKRYSALKVCDLKVLIENHKKIHNEECESNADTEESVTSEEQMDILKMSKIDLLKKCKELCVTKRSSKNKSQLIELINSKNKTSNNTEEYKNILISEDVINELSPSLIEPITETLNVIDLFCGCGGMSKGFSIIFAVQKRCQKIIATFAPA